MNIEVQRPAALQKDAPAPVFLNLLNDNGELIGSVCVYPRWSEPGKLNHFQVEVHKGAAISPEIDIRVTI